MVARHPFDRLVSAYHDKLLQSNAMEYLRPLIIDYVRHGITHIPPEEYRKYFRADRLYGVPDNPTLREHLDHYDDYRKTTEIGNPYRVNFTEFLLYITTYGVGRVTTHWISMYHTCLPCDVKYDVILKMETLENDSHYIIDKMKAIAPVSGYTDLPDLNSFRDVKQGTWNRTMLPGFVHRTLMNRSLADEYSATPQPLVIQQLPEFENVSDTLIEHLLLNVYWNDMIMFGYDFDLEQRLTECSFTYDDQACC
jgi:hypothetical protein